MIAENKNDGTVDLIMNVISNTQNSRPKLPFLHVKSSQFLSQTYLCARALNN